MQHKYSVVEYHSEKGDTGQRKEFNTLKEAQRDLRELHGEMQGEYIVTPIYCGQFIAHDKQMPIALDGWKYVIEYNFN